MSLLSLFNLIKLTPEDLLLSRKFDQLPLDFKDKVATFMETYLQNEEYEKCLIVNEYLEYIKTK